MKKILATLLTVALFAGISASTSFAKMYISGNLGAVFLNDSDIDDGLDTGEFTFDTGFGVTGALGSTIGNSARLEVELGYRSNDLDKLTVDGLGSVSISGDASALSVMGNAYYDIKTDSNFSPFIGGGLGFAKTEVDIDTLNIGSEDDTVFAYQVMLGTSYAATEKVNIDLQYRYFGTEDPEFEGLDAEYGSHNIMVGLRYMF